MRVVGKSIGDKLDIGYRHDHSTVVFVGRIAGLGLCHVLQVRRDVAKNLRAKTNSFKETVVRNRKLQQKRLHASYGKFPATWE